MPYVAILVALLAPHFALDGTRFVPAAAAAAQGPQLAYDDNLYRGDDLDDSDDDDDADDGDEPDDDDDDDSAHAPDGDGQWDPGEARSVSA